MEITMNYEILVNKDNPINIEYLNNIVIPNLEKVEFFRDNEDIFNEFKIENKSIYLESATKKAFYALREYLKEKNIIFDICSGYLSLENQEYKYNSFLKRNGRVLTGKRMAKPKFSEHHTGLAIDCDFYKDGDWGGMVPYDDGNENEETKYIQSILSQFGFIIRYPKGKESITGYGYEPWHIRYVGKDLAYKLYSEDITLEEYYYELQEKKINYKK